MKKNKDIGWEKKDNNVGSDGNYDDTLIKNQISILNNKVNKLDEETDLQLEQKANKNELHEHNNKDVLDSITKEYIDNITSEVPTDLSLENSMLYLIDSNGNNIGNGVVLDISNDSNNNGGNQEPVYETQYVDLTFDVNTDSLIFDSNVEDCTCGLEYSSNVTSSDIPAFTNLIPWKPLSSAPNASAGIQGYRGKLEYIGDNVVKYTKTDTEPTNKGLFKSQISSDDMPNTIPNNIYYRRVYKSTDNVNYTVEHGTFTTNADGTFTRTTLFNITGISEPGATHYVKNPLLLNLTAMYGEGNEPTKEEMLDIIPEDVWSIDNYTPGGSATFTLTSKDESGQTIDTFVSGSDDNTIDIVSGGSVSITGVKPTSLSLTNVKISVLVNNGTQNDPSMGQVNNTNIINLHNVDRLLFLGDSYTEGMYYQKGKAFVCQLSEQLDYSCEAYGWGGYTCETLSDNIDNNLSRFNPIRVRQLNATRAMLMSFVNDMAKNAQNSLIFQRGMERLINTVKHMGCQPIVCTEYRNVWGIGLEPALKALAQQYQCDFWNILPYSVFLNTKNASDNNSLSNYYAGSHPGQRTGGIIFNNYLKFAKNLPRPTSAIKIFRLRDGVTVSDVDDLLYDDRRGKLLKFKEINIAHSALSNASDWDSLGSMSGSSGVGVTSEYGKLMNNENVNFGDYALVECVLPSLKGNISSVKLCLSDKSVEIYAKTLNGFVRVSDTITSFDKFLDYDKITFLLHKTNGFVLNDIYVEWKGNKVDKHNITYCPPLIKGTELLKNNTVDNMSWLTVNGTVTATEPTNYTPMPKGCTKLITIDNTNNVSFGVKQTSTPGMSNNLRVRVVCRYNPTNGDSSINENSYDRKLLALRVKGQYSASLGGNSYYELLQEVDMAWTMCEFDVECNEGTTFTILSPDTPNIEVCYISVIEIGEQGIQEVNSSTNIDAYTKEEVDSIIQDYTGGKKQVYLTQAEYDVLTDTEINDPYTVYNITDAVESVIPVDLAMNDNVLNLVDNDGSVIGEGVEINVNLDLSEYALKTDLPTNVSDLSNDAGYATETFVTNKISEITPSGGTADEVILTSPNGTKFRLVVSDDGVLSAEMIIIRGNIIVSAETLDIVKGTSGTFTVQLDTAPSINQVVNIESDNTAVTVTPNSLTFSSDNYSVAQVVTVNIPENEEVKDDSIVSITLSSEGVSDKNVAITAQAQESEPESDIISDGILMYFDSDLITASAGTPINGTSINDAMVPNQTLRFRQFKDDGSDGITDDYNGIYFNDKGLMEPMMDNATTVFGETEETSIRTIEIFGKFDGTIDPNRIKNIGGICHQHSPINYNRQLVKRAGDGYEITYGATVVRQMNYPQYSTGGGMASGYFHVAYTDSATKNSEENNICNWLSFAFGSAANMGSLIYTTIYAVRLYNRVLSSDELDHNMAIDLAKVNYTENLQE